MPEMSLLKRRLAPLILATLLFAMSAGCRRPDTVPVEVADEPESAPLPSTLHFADPAAEGQIKSGFHPVEQGAWRWAEQEFTVALGPPPGSERTGASLSLRFSLPEAVLKQLGPVTISATVAGVSLDPKTYTQAGEYIFVRDVPGEALAGDAVRVAFSLDKAIAPTETDRRQLGVIVSSVSLESER